MSLKQSENKKVESSYKESIFPQRRNPTYKLKLKNPILCFFCDEKLRETTGRKKKWDSLNKLHAHCSYEHPKENFRNYLIDLADQIIKRKLF